MNNVNNVDTTTTMYYDDGTVVPYYVGLGGTIATKTERSGSCISGSVDSRRNRYSENKITYWLVLYIVHR